VSAVISRTAATITKQASCPSCDTGFTHPATRPQRYCSPKCRDIASNARRAPTGNRPGRPRTGAKTLGAISPLRNSDVASTASQAHVLPLSEKTSRHRVGDRVRIWVDDASIGCGERHLMVTEIGRVHVKLYSFANLAEVTVTRRDFEAHAEAYRSNPVTVLGILERNLRAYERARLDHDKPLERAVEALRKQAAEVSP
jgi:hypothetical protein